MHHTQIMVVQVLQSLKNLLSVTLNDHLMEWCIHSSVQTLERVRHVLHEDPLLALASLSIFLRHTTIVLYDVFMSEASQKFQLVLHLCYQKLILSLHYLDCQLGRNVEFSGRVSLVCLIGALVDFPKGAFTKHASFLNRHKLLLPNLIDFNL